MLATGARTGAAWGVSGVDPEPFTKTVLTVGTALYSAYVIGNEIYKYNTASVDSKETKKAGTGTPRKKSSAQLRKEWEKGEGKEWPKEPGDPTRNQAAYHKVPLADGGYDGYPNIEPLPRGDHIDLHRNNGDSARWGRRRN